MLLSPLGVEQVHKTGQRLARLKVHAMYVSPVERCRQTAEILSHYVNLPGQVREPLAELDYGQWTRAALADLRREERFKRWNAHRSGTQIPGGEWMLEVQARIVREILELRDKHPGETVVLVSHGDVIKAAAAYVLGTPPDLLLRIEISLASVTVIAWGDYGPWVLAVNSTGDVPMPY